MKTSSLKPGPALLLQAAVVLIGLAVLAFLLWEPHIEGRNAKATVFQVYFKDPFLAYVYAGSIPFFIGVQRAFGMLGLIRKSGQFSQATVGSLRAIKICALVVAGFVAGAAVIVLLSGDGEDRPAGFFMCLLVGGTSSVVAATAAILARKLQTVLGRSEYGGS